MPSRFTDKVVIVTGAAHGLARATALGFAREGASLCLVDIKEDALENTRTDVEQCGAEVLALTGDLSSQAFCAEVVQRTVERFGKLDVLCNIAGIVLMHHVKDVTPEEWQRIVAVNLAAPLWLSQAAIPHLLETGGNIVNCGSQSGLKGSAYIVPYSMTKAGIVMMTKSMAMEFINQPIRINAVCPGTMIETNMSVDFKVPDAIDPSLFARYSGLRPPMVPPDVASMFLYVASDEARAIHGAILSVDGGTTAD